MTRRIFIDVDTQYDFCDPKGALFVAGAPEAAKVCGRLVSQAVREGALVLGSVDSHTHEAWEFNTNANVGPAGEKPGFPPHCVKGTWGWLKVPETLPARFAFVPVEPHEPSYPASAQAVYFEKEVYSLFANPNAAKVLDRVAGDEAVEFVVFGVATDYCVRAAALGLREWAAGKGGAAANSTVTVVRDAVAGVAEESTARAWRELEAAGVQVADSSRYLSA